MKIFKVQSEFSVQTMPKNVLKGNYYETIYGSGRSECSSYRVVKKYFHAYKHFCFSP